MGKKAVTYNNNNNSGWFNRFGAANSQTSKNTRIWWWMDYGRSINEIKWKRKEKKTERDGSRVEI